MPRQLMPINLVQEEVHLALAAQLQAVDTQPPGFPQTPGARRSQNTLLLLCNHALPLCSTGCACSRKLANAARLQLPQQLLNWALSSAPGARSETHGRPGQEEEQAADVGRGAQAGRRPSHAAGGRPGRAAREGHVGRGPLVGPGREPCQLHPRPLAAARSSPPGSVLTPRRNFSHLRGRCRTGAITHGEEAPPASPARRT
jgi:hypothetical protein